MPKKGSEFEREICKRLSLWWTQDMDTPRDDVFWRSSNSGGRATIRSRQGMKTFGQYGDVQATDPIGQPLIDLCTIELKRGYKDTNIHSLLDKLDSQKDQPYADFVQQALRDSRKAGSRSWILITRRDRKEALITFPGAIDKRVRDDLAGVKSRCRLMFKTSDGRACQIFIYRLKDFLEKVDPFNFQ